MPTAGTAPETIAAFDRYASYVERHPRVVVIPTFEDLAIADFEEIAGLPVIFAGLSLDPSREVDGKVMGPSAFFDHDLVHGQRWADTSTNLFPASGRLVDGAFVARVVQRLTEREAFLRALDLARGKLQGGGPLVSFLRRILTAPGSGAPGVAPPLSARERLDKFDFYMFHELRVELSSGAGIVPCVESCWSIPAVFRLVREKLVRSTLQTQFGRPLALLGFQEHDVGAALEGIEKVIAAAIAEPVSPSRARPGDARATLERFR